MQFPATYGGYTLLAQLGEGGMAEVFLARKIGLGGFSKLQVIKRILPSLAREPEFVQMFLDEARLAARFEHPNVVQVYDLGEADGTIFIAMEYLAGQSVAGLAKEAVKHGIGVPPPFSARIVAEACEGLHYVHDFKELDGSPLNIVHRDVSPQNLFVTYEGRVKLLDFGVAKAASTLSRTRTGSVKGKVSYMAPEQCRGETVDRRADVFALGVVLLELITGRRIFKNENEYALIRQLSLGEFAKPSEMGLPAPAPLLAVCDRAMAFRREDRFQSCGEMKGELEKWLHAGPPAGANQVAALMGQLFKDDIALRQQVLLATDDRAEVFQKVKQETSHTSLPSLGSLALEQRTITRRGMTNAQAAPRRSPGVLIAVILTAVLGASFGLALKLQQPSAGVTGQTPDAAVAVATQVPDASVTPVPVAVVPVAVPDASVAVAEPPKAVNGGTVTPVLTKRPPPVKPKPATVIVHSKPDGCAVVVNGKAAGTTPQQLSLEAGDFTVEVTCAGFAAEKKTAHGAAGESVTFDFAPQPAGKGFLALKTSPWSVVYEGERELGMTPIPKLELTAGAHTLRAVNSEQRLEKTFSVTIKAGETTARTLDLTAQ
jgi:serine/threonine-protein kinase